MSTDTEHPDPEDMFNDTRMSFGDHIEDLRTHLLRALKGFAIGMILGFWPLGPYVLRIIVDPLDDQLYQFEKRKLDKEMEEAQQRLIARGAAPRSADFKLEFRKDQILKLLGKNGAEPAAADPPVLDKMVNGFEDMLHDLDAIEMIEQDVREAGHYVTLDVRLANSKPVTDLLLKETLNVRRPKPSTMHITEAFMVYFKVALITGLVISSPWVFYHIWMFIAAGLYPHEKRIVNVYLPFSVALFIIGVVTCQIFVMPNAVAAMLWFNEWLGLAQDLRLNEWLGFALMMPVVFGISFQTPLVMMFFHKVGILGVQTYRDYRRIAFFVLAIFAAIITPTVDPWSMLFLWVPMCGLYELGILLCIWQGEQNRLFEWEEEEEKSNELVEV
jgi:sec-independent protein translocase protein TatC